MSAADEARSKSAETVIEAFKAEVLDKHGGPAQYLRKVLDGKDQREEFAEWLWQAFPLRDDVEYHLDATALPPVSPDNLAARKASVVHVALLGFAPECSMKPNPSSHASYQLLQHIVMQGFETGDQPLQCKLLAAGTMEPDNYPWKSLCASQPIPAFSLAFTKGMLRASTVLALLCQWWQEGCADILLRSFPHIKETCSTVYVYHVQHLTLQDEVFHNFRLSLKGSIRKPPNFLTWIQVLTKLKSCGYEDSAAVIARFNLTVAKSMQLAGQKATAVGNLMNLMPPEVLDMF